MQVNHLILQFSEALNVLFCNFMRSKLHKIGSAQHKKSRARALLFDG